MRERILQCLRYFSKREVDYGLPLKYLNEKEFALFDEMMEYDKVHSISVLKGVMKDPLLKDDHIYYKLALLHDIGKGEVTFIQRIKKVIIGDYHLNNHPVYSYYKLKEINYQLAVLCKHHHTDNYSDKMEAFKKIDDIS